LDCSIKQTRLLFLSAYVCAVKSERTETANAYIQAHSNTHKN